jgi:TolA-binding protein
MADDVCEGIENFLNIIVNTTEQSGNMKKELKQTIFETVSNLRKRIVKLMDSRDSKTSAIGELEAQVSKMKTEIDACRSPNAEVHGEPSLTRSQELAVMTTRDVAPPGGRNRKLFGSPQPREERQNIQIDRYCERKSTSRHNQRITEIQDKFY